MILGRPGIRYISLHGFHFALRWAIDMANSGDRDGDNVLRFCLHRLYAPYRRPTLAIDFARSMLSQKIPVRMGIAFGLVRSSPVSL